MFITMEAFSVQVVVVESTTAANDIDNVVKICDTVHACCVICDMECRLWIVSSCLINAAAVQRRSVCSFCWMLLRNCCSIFKTFTTRRTVHVVQITRKFLSTMGLLQRKAVASVTLHSHFCGHSLQRYLSLAECLEPLLLDFLPIDLAGKSF